jgi:hypothetical protein
VSLPRYSEVLLRLAGTLKREDFLLTVTGAPVQRFEGGVTV